MTNEPPFAWARKVDDSLRELDQIPLTGNAPKIDIHQISEAIASRFQTPAFSIELGDCSWCEEDEIKEGLGSDVISLGVSITPLVGDIIWMMGREDMAHLTTWQMFGKTRSRTIHSEVLQEGFYRYLVVEALDAIQEIEPFNAFSIKINEGAIVPDKAAYCIDVRLRFEKRSCWGCLVIPSRFFTSWQRHFSTLREVFSMSTMSQSIEVPLVISGGSFSITAPQFKKLKKGDLVLLDRGGYDPRHHEGIAEMILGSTPLFRTSVKENKLKVLDYALANEEMMKNSTSVEKTAAETNEETVAIKELPIHVTVELARIRMTVDQLMKLAPGNFLELPIHPDQEVSLTVNGQRIGRAELVHLGEALGVRILETA